MEKRALSSIQSILGPEALEYIGDKNVYFHNVSAFFKPKEQSLTFISQDYEEHLSKIYTHDASIIFCPHTFALDPKKIKNKCIIKVKDPRHAFAKVLNAISLDAHPRAIKSTQTIHASVQLGENIYIGPNVIIEEGVIIGNNTIIKGNAYIYSQTQIGKNVIIHANTVIGKEGFGFVKEEDGTLIRFPHLGKVIIEDHVEIGSSVTIDKGALLNTIIGQGTKLDNQVHIAHHVTIGKNCTIASGVTSCGGVNIKDNVFIGPGVTISNNLTINDNAHLTLGSTVIRNVSKGKRVTGFFSMDHKNFLTQQKNLYKISQKIKPH